MRRTYVCAALCQTEEHEMVWTRKFENISNLSSWGFKMANWATLICLESVIYILLKINSTEYILSYMLQEVVQGVMLTKWTMQVEGVDV